MKSAIFISDADVQIVLTPETAIDKDVLAHIEGRAGRTHINVFRGSSYEARGGWLRFSTVEDSAYSYSYPRHADDKSLIVRLTQLEGA